MVRAAQKKYTVSERCACRVLAIHRTSHRYVSKRAQPVALIRRLRDLALSRPRYGYRRLLILLRRENWKINHKRLYRVHKEEGQPSGESELRVDSA